MSEDMNQLGDMSLRRFEPYPAYKDSGVEWLEKVPASWDVWRLKFASKVIMGQSPPSKYYNTSCDGFPFLQGNADFGVEHPSVRIFSTVSPKIAKRGDHLLSVRAPVGALNTADQEYGIGRGLCAIRIRPPLVNGRFCRWVLSVSSQALDAIAVGSTYKAVSAEDVANLEIPLPTEDEQRAIATFLDREMAKIDALVAKKERLIELLQEKRTALITRAVTKGLDSNVPMKDSGVEWLGGVPQGWTRDALKRVASVRGRIGFRGYTSDDLIDEGNGALTLGGVNLTDVGRLDLSTRTYISWDKYEESPEIKVSKDDLLIGQRGTCGRVVLVDRDIGPSTINPSLVLLKNPMIDSRFLCYWLMGRFVQSLLDSYLSATAVPMLSQEQIGNVPVCYPEFREQKAIVGYVDQETRAIDATVSKVETAIERLQEYRTALISAAVTGKIDVREEIT